MTKTIGQYEIGELLGEGGLGQVHAAFDTVLQREVAVKSLRPELLNDTNFVERFRVEATNLARLNHPNITTIYSLIPDGKNLYMVMERVRGHTLDDILQKRKAPIEMRESLAIIARAADGLAYAHSMGVIHRDIKPANLMIAENGVLKIMDFGIARVRGSQRLTRTGSIVGTLAYMAPEQLRGEEGDEASDLYSLAIVLYEMLSGNPPFSATSEYDLMQAQINQRPERLIPRVPGLSPAVETALLRALSKKPAQRFPSTRAFSDALGASALRMDAPKILHNDTRLLETPVPLAPATPQRRSAFDRVAAALPFGTMLSPELRAAALGGGGALVIALAFAGFMFWPSSAPAPSRAAPPPAPAAPAKPIAAAPTPTPPAQSVTQVNVPDASAKPGMAMPGNGGTAAKPMSPPPASLADLIPAADRGDPAAQNALGVKYVAGEDGLPRDDVKAHDGAVMALAYLPDGGKLVSAGADGAVSIWNPATGQRTAGLTGHPGAILALAVSHDGKWLAAGGSGATVLIWNAATGAVTQRLATRFNEVKSVAFSKAGGRLAVGGDDATIEWWNVATGERLAAVTSHARNVQALAFAPDGSRFASGGDGTTIDLWSAN